jgi:hypothetical protein
MKNLTPRDRKISLIVKGGLMAAPTVHDVVIGIWVFYSKGSTHGGRLCYFNIVINRLDPYGPRAGAHLKL